MTNNSEVTLMFEDVSENPYITSLLRGVNLFYGNYTKIHLANTQEEFEILLRIPGAIPTKWWDKYLVVLWGELATSTALYERGFMYVRRRYYHWARCYWEEQW